MPGTYAHLIITEKALDQFRANQDIHPNLRGSALTHSHFVHLGCVGPDYPYLDIVQPKQKDWADHRHYHHTEDVIKSTARKLLDLWLQGFKKIVKQYPVRVSHEGESYVLILCDKGSKMALYKDLGSTITHVDFPYYREGKKVPCNE